MKPSEQLALDHQNAPYNGAKSLRAVLRQLLLNDTEEQVASRLGVTQSWVSDHLTGRRKCIQKRLRPRIASGLGISVGHLANLMRR
jgi:transcriptional antiterminator